MLNLLHASFFFFKTTCMISFSSIDRGCQSIAQPCAVSPFFFLILQQSLCILDSRLLPSLHAFAYSGASSFSSSSTECHWLLFVVLRSLIFTAARLSPWFNSWWVCAEPPRDNPACIKRDHVRPPPFFPGRFCPPFYPLFYASLLLPSQLGRWRVFNKRLQCWSDSVRSSTSLEKFHSEPFTQGNHSYFCQL